MNNSYRAFILKTVILPSLLVAIVVSVFVSVPSYYLTEKVENEQRTLLNQERRFRTLFSDVRFLMDQYALLKRYGDKFYDLEARGLVSGVKRLQWIDSILLFSYAYRFQNLQAALMPNKVVSGKTVDGVSIPNKLFYLNPIRYNATMPVDVDFLRFVRFVGEKISQFYFFDKCSFADHRLGDLYMVKPDKISIFSVGAENNPVSVQCLFSVVTSKPRVRSVK